MKLKTLVIVVAILAVLSGAVYFTQRPSAPAVTDQRVGQPIVSAETVEHAAKIRLSDQGKNILLTKQPDGTWRVASYYDFPADFSKLTTFVNELTSAKIEQFVTANPEKMGRLEFKDTQIAMLDGADKPTWEITLGKNAEAGGKFLKFDNENRAYRTGLSVWLDTEAKNWADATLLSVKPEDVAKVEIDFSNGTPVIAARPKKGEAFRAEDAPAGKQLSTEKINALLSSLGNLRFTDTNDLNDPNAVAARKNQRSVKITTFDGQAYTIALGRKPEEKIVKPPKVATDAKGGLASVEAVANAVKAGDKVTDAPGEPAGKTPSPKLPEPEVETIPAGPVFVTVSSSNENAPINARMKQRAFQIYEYAFTGLPAAPADLLEAIPSPTATGPANGTPAAMKEEAKPTNMPAPTPPAPGK